MRRLTKKIALLLRPMAGYQHEVLRGIQRYATGHTHWRWQGIVPDDLAPAALAHWRPHGAIGMIETPPLAAAVKQLGIPTVDVSRWFDRPSGAQVAVDDRRVGELAASYFLQRGFKQFAFIGSVTEWFAVQRQRGFVETLRQAGFSCADIVVVDPERTMSQSAVWSQANPALGRRLAALPKPLAVFASDDPVGLMILATCGQVGIAVPRDIAVLGVDNDSLISALANPPLSSIQYPAQRIGFHAAQLLDDLMSGRARPPAPILLPPLGVVTRASTDRLAVDDTTVLRAVSRIRDHARDRISIAMLADQLAVSRRVLERKFLKTLRHGIHDEIRRTRLELAQKILRETDLKTSVVAARSGFANATRLAILFKRHCGLSPSVYRKLADTAHQSGAELEGV